MERRKSMMNVVRGKFQKEVLTALKVSFMLLCKFITVREMGAEH